MRCQTESVSTVVLVHAPLVGPSTWRWVAEELHQRGYDVVVPVLRDDAEVDGDRLQHSLIERAASAVPVNAEVVLVGHSGAGLLLPLIAQRSRARVARYVFVDSGLPPAEGRLVTAGEDFRASLQERVEADSRLPGWHTWWGDGTMDGMVADAERRCDVVADIPRLPLAYFDAKARLSAGWRSAGCGYVLLSEVYRPAAEEAKAEGWPVHEVLGTHLELVNRPAAVADAIIQAAHMASPR